MGYVEYRPRCGPIHKSFILSAFSLLWPKEANPIAGNEEVLNHKMTALPSEHFPYVAIGPVHRGVFILCTWLSRHKRPQGIIAMPATTTASFTDTSTSSTSVTDADEDTHTVVTTVPGTAVSTHARTAFASQTHTPYSTESFHNYTSSVTVTHGNGKWTLKDDLTVCGLHTVNLKKYGHFIF